VRKRREKAMRAVRTQSRTTKKDGEQYKASRNNEEEKTMKKQLKKYKKEVFKLSNIT
jgi:hypothetical protein